MLIDRLLVLKTRWLAARREVTRQRLGAAAGDAARRYNRLDDAIVAYQDYLARRPNDFGVRLRLVDVLRDAGRPVEAVFHLERLARRRAGDLKVLILLAEALDESGALDRAKEVYTDVLRRAPSNENAAEALTKILQDQRLDDFGMPAPPKAGDAVLSFDIWIDASGASEFAIQETLEAIGETVPEAAGVLVAGRASNEAVAVKRASGDAARQGDGAVLYVRAGVILRRGAVPWLRWALDQGAMAAYADEEAPDGEPILQSAPDRFDLATNPAPPSLIMFASGSFRAEEGGIGSLERLLAEGEVMHVPLVLARTGGRQQGNAEAPALPPGEDRLLVVIPSRDREDDLRVMVSSLCRRAAQPERLDIIVIDNGSLVPLRFDSLGATRGASVSVKRVNEPFNWSRLNNRACVDQEQPIVVFANNDMEMLTSDWDDRLRGLLRMEAVAVVGARLLYPNGLLQHGGIVMGGLNGEPLHDGWRARGEDPGPLQRWIRRRPATAVTGGFMAVKRLVFDQVRGFDDVDLPISCSDVDLCLKVREQGWSVLYAPEIEVKHHESLTRGHAKDQAEHLRARTEMQTLLERWGDRATYDPTRNPQWEGRGVRLYAGRRPLGRDQVVDWALKTASRCRRIAL